MNVKPIKKEERHHYSCAKVVFLFQKKAQQSKKNAHYTKFGKNYVNGDNLLPNLRRDEDNWKVVLIEEEFTKRMFETE